MMLNYIKHNYFPVIGLLGLLAVNANAAAPQGESCEQIRLQIKAQTGVLPKPDTTMLEKLDAQPECRFSTAEMYQAAFGDKPMPKKERRDRRAKHRDDDDD
jgi:hypothetical protein